MGRMSDAPRCAFPHCDREYRAKSYCSVHYSQYRAGRALTEARPARGAPLADRVEYYSMPLTESQCIAWMGYVAPDGYARLSVNGVSREVHRLIFEMGHGEIPSGAQIDHMCGVRCCVNPHHLRAASPKQNAWNRKRVSGQASGHKNVYRNGSGWIVKMEVDGEKLSFGTFAELDAAVAVAEEKRKDLLGEFATLRGRG